MRFRPKVTQCFHYIFYPKYQQYFVWLLSKYFKLYTYTFKNFLQKKNNFIFITVETQYLKYEYKGIQVYWIENRKFTPFRRFINKLPQYFIQVYEKFEISQLSWMIAFSPCSSTPPLKSAADRAPIIFQ